MNNEEWLRDGRKIPDEVMGYIRKIAVEAVRERGQSPEVVAEIFNSILKFLSLDKALDASVGPGRSCSSFVFERW